MSAYGEFINGYGYVLTIWRQQGRTDECQRAVDSQVFQRFCGQADVPHVHTALVDDRVGAHRLGFAVGGAQEAEQCEDAAQQRQAGQRAESDAHLRVVGGHVVAVLEQQGGDLGHPHDVNAKLSAVRTSRVPTSQSSMSGARTGEADQSSNVAMRPTVSSSGGAGGSCGPRTM
ncbi:hypothetical protein ADL03_07705 [Nocardia sp. NRRL S-836]|nr:hypothetical protein ADL03_07705 [Nocardia sp. NRRL S-836]